MSCYHPQVQLYCRECGEGWPSHNESRKEIDELHGLRLEIARLTKDNAELEGVVQLQRDAIAAFAASENAVRAKLDVATKALELAFEFMQRKLGTNGDFAQSKDRELFNRVRAAIATENVVGDAATGLGVHHAEGNVGFKTPRLPPSTAEKKPEPPDHGEDQCKPGCNYPFTACTPSPPDKPQGEPEEK